MDGVHALPPSLLATLPTDPADVLAVAQQIAAYAFSSKAAQGDAEVNQVRAILAQRQSELRALERRCDELEAELVHARAEARRCASEAERLQNEKASLVDTVKNLSKEVNKLDSFKRNVLRTLNEEAAETAADHMAVSPAVAELPSAMKSFGLSGSAGGRASDFGSVAAPPAAVPDGKGFFRMARSRLSPEAFAAFLSSIKALNAHTRTRAQTLEDAALLFGSENDDLYASFEALLAAHLA